jgi:alkylation response protein AidB-like acyl-CoA dehydrogenase
MAEPGELTMLRESARRLASDAMPQYWTSEGRTGRSDPALWRRIADDGWLLAGLDEAHGGFGVGIATTAAIMQEAGRGLITEPLIAHYVALTLIETLADGELKQDVIAATTEGRRKLAFACTEPRARFAWDRPATTVGRDGDALRLDGVKAVVLGGGDADLIVTAARDESGELAVALRAYPLVDGTGAADIGFDAVSLRPEALLARGRKAREAIERALDAGAILATAAALGMMQESFRTTLDYVKQRVQFGEPIGRNQALQHRLVDLLRMVRESEILLNEAVAAFDADSPDRALAVSAVRIAASEAMRRVGQEAVQMHGAIGTTDEAAISHYFRALTAMRPLFGDADHHRRRFAALERQRAA